MEILFDVQSSIIRRLDEKVIAAGTSVIAEFTFTSDWYGENIRKAAFTANGKTFYVTLNSDNKCIVPPACLTNDVQYFTVSVFSQNMTTIKSTVYVSSSGGSYDDAGFISTFVYDSVTESSQWYIVHNLNKFPSVTVVDEDGYEIICSVQYIDLDTCVCIFDQPFKGKAYLN